MKNPFAIPQGFERPDPDPLDAVLDELRKADAAVRAQLPALWPGYRWECDVVFDPSLNVLESSIVDGVTVRLAYVARPVPGTSRRPLAADD